MYNMNALHKDPGIGVFYLMNNRIRAIHVHIRRDNISRSAQRVVGHSTDTRAIASHAVYTVKVWSGPFLG